jgi:hypothetical protein
MGPYCRQYKTTLYFLFSLTAQLGHIVVVSKHKLVRRYYTVYERSPRRQASCNQLGVLLGGSLTCLIGREVLGQIVWKTRKILALSDAEWHCELKG